MDKIIVRGGKRLEGQVNISTAKNSVLPIIAASLLSNDEVVINNVPMLEDVLTICNVISQLGFNIKIDRITNRIIIKTEGTIPLIPDSDLVRKMRASFLIMGPILAKYGEFRLDRPGGCNIGSRPIDLHLKGLELLGASFKSDFNGQIIARCNKLKGNIVYLDFPSVGATENIMMAASVAKGNTVIKNAAEEPEIIDLANFLNSMGAKISGAGTGEINIIGVENLKGTSYTPIYDRIEAGTFMVAAAITGSKIQINGVNEEHSYPLIEKLKECGTNFSFIEGTDNVIVEGSSYIKPVDIKTMPHPGFPTDMQSQMMSLLSLARGSSIVSETVFENRFMHVPELIRMGANIKIDSRTAFITGVNNLNGCDVKATDLRAGAALILAGLVADGETRISDIYHIDRGYVNIEEKFRGLKVDIYRKDV